jgi:hypothetical protein
MGAQLALAEYTGGTGWTTEQLREVGPALMSVAGRPRGRRGAAIMSQFEWLLWFGTNWERIESQVGQAVQAARTGQLIQWVMAHK